MLRPAHATLSTSFPPSLSLAACSLPPPLPPSLPPSPVHVITTTYRPVPLSHSLFAGGELFQILDQRTPFAAAMHQKAQEVGGKEGRAGRGEGGREGGSEDREGGEAPSDSACACAICGNCQLFLLCRPFFLLPFFFLLLPFPPFCLSIVSLS